MKKIKYVVLFILLFPFSIKATTSISGAFIDGNNIVKVGKEYSQGFRIQFSDLKKNTTDTLGIWIAGFELVYDEDVFIIESIENDRIWNSYIYKENGKTYVISQFANDPYHNACVDGVLYCADYGISIKFYVKDTDKTTTEIKMNEASAWVFQVSDDLNPEYNTSDMIELEYSSVVSKTITINRQENITIEEPKSIVSSSKPKTTKTVKSTKKTTTNTKTEVKKSTNNDLKILKVSGYPINFDKEKKEYTITINEEINALKIQAKPEDEKATTEIIGADDIDKNNGEILVNVKAENGDINTYKILVKKEKIVAPKEKEKFKIGKNELIIVAIILGSIIFIILIIFLVIHIRDRKIDKAIDSL